MISKERMGSVLEQLKSASDGNDASIAIDEWYSLTVTYRGHRRTTELTYADFSLGEVRAITSNDDYLIILMPDGVSFTMRAV